jgi:hypothetical protein
MCYDSMIDMVLSIIMMPRKIIRSAAIGWIDMFIYLHLKCIPISINSASNCKGDVIISIAIEKGTRKKYFGFPNTLVPPPESSIG